MNIQVLSDLHFEWFEDAGRGLTAALDPTGIDVLILAGDVAPGWQIAGALRRFCDRYKHVIYVLGNHEFHKARREDVLRSISEVRSRNLHVLDCAAVEIEGQRFLGASLWFPRDPNPELRKIPNDFHIIPDFKHWVFIQNALALEFLGRVTRESDVVITHYLPSSKSVSERFKDAVLNSHFVCPEAEKIILERKPKLWIHGHTHDSKDYFIGRTRILCNPFGYVTHELNPEFDLRLVLELYV